MAASYNEDTLVLLFNCFCRKLPQSRAAPWGSVTVQAAFELDQTWPLALRSARLVDYRQLTVPLASGYSADDRSANVLVNILAVVEQFCTSESVVVCGAAKPISEVCGLRRSSIDLVK